MINIRRFLGFLLTNLAYQAMVGEFGVNSIIKKPMGTLFGYDESFLGVIDATQIIGQLTGCLLTLFITINPAKGYLAYGLFNGFFGILLCLPRYISNIVIRDLVLLISFFCQSFFTASITFTQILLNNDQTEESTKSEQSIWYSFIFFGDLCSVIIAQYLISSWGFQWEVVKLLWNAHIILIGVLLYLFYRENVIQQSEIREILQSQSNQGDQTYDIEDGVQIHNVRKMEDFSKLQIFVVLCKKMFKYLKQPKALLIVLSFALIQGLNGSQLYWVPYYYIQNNQQAYSTIASSLISLSLMVGGLFSELILYDFFNLQRYSKRISYLLLFLSTLTYFILWTKRYDEPKTQIILFSLANILISSTYCRISTADVIEESKGNHHKAKTMFLMSHLLRNAIISIFVIVCGYIMEINLHNFWHAILTTILIAFLVGTVRIYYYQQSSQKQDQMKLQAPQTK